MHKDNHSFGGRRSKMTDRSRIVVYLDDDEKEKVEAAAEYARISVSNFAAKAVLEEARRVNLEGKLSRRKR